MNTTSSELEAARSSAPHAWIETYTGRKFWPLAPSPDDIDIFDIAQALSMTCRYKGHTNEFYSVAEHSVLLAEKLPPHLRLRRASRYRSRSASGGGSRTLLAP